MKGNKEAIQRLFKEDGYAEGVQKNFRYHVDAHKDLDVLGRCKALNQLLEDNGLWDVEMGTKPRLAAQQDPGFRSRVALMAAIDLSTPQRACTGVAAHVPPSRVPHRSAVTAPAGSVSGRSDRSNNCSGPAKQLQAALAGIDVITAEAKKLRTETAARRQSASKSRKPAPAAAAQASQHAEAPRSPRSQPPFTSPPAQPSNTRSQSKSPPSSHATVHTPLVPSCKVSKAEKSCSRDTSTSSKEAGANLPPDGRFAPGACSPKSTPSPRAQQHEQTACHETRTPQRATPSLLVDQPGSQLSTISTLMDVISELEAEQAGTAASDRNNTPTAASRINSTTARQDTSANSAKGTAPGTADPRSAAESVQVPKAGGEAACPDRCAAASAERAVLEDSADGLIALLNPRSSGAPRGVTQAPESTSESRASAQPETQSQPDEPLLQSVICRDRAQPAAESSHSHAQEGTCRAAPAAAQRVYTKERLREPCKAPASAEEPSSHQRLVDAAVRIQRNFRQHTRRRKQNPQRVPSKPLAPEATTRTTLELVNDTLLAPRPTLCCSNCEGSERKQECQTSSSNAEPARSSGERCTARQTCPCDWVADVQRTKFAAPACCSAADLRYPNADADVGDMASHASHAAVQGFEESNSMAEPSGAFRDKRQRSTRPRTASAHRTDHDFKLGGGACTHVPKLPLRALGRHEASTKKGCREVGSTRRRPLSACVASLRVQKLASPLHGPHAEQATWESAARLLPWCTGRESQRGALGGVSMKSRVALPTACSSEPLLHDLKNAHALVNDGNTPSLMTVKDDAVLTAVEPEKQAWQGTKAALPCDAVAEESNILLTAVEPEPHAWQGTKAALPCDAVAEESNILLPLNPIKVRCSTETRLAASARVCFDHAVTGSSRNHAAALQRLLQRAMQLDKETAAARVDHFIRAKHGGGALFDGDAWKTPRLPVFTYH